MLPQIPLASSSVDILVLGLGFIGQYLHSYAALEGISTMASTTTGRNNTISFKFDPESSDGYSVLPEARIIVITFPLPTLQSPKFFMENYRETHATVPKIVLLGSTGAFKRLESSKSDDVLNRNLKNEGSVTIDGLDTDNVWHDRNGPIQEDARILIENELLALGGCVLNLSGLWGGTFF